MVLPLAILPLLLPAVVAADYKWPSATDELEDILYLHSGYIRRGIVDGVSPCGFAITPGRGHQESASWVRTAYHDMATHNATAGTGGLDASILFETFRAENTGEAFNATFGFLGSLYNIRASMADLIAIGVRVSIEACGGPLIPIRGGRVDATEAGPLGVPEPQQGIDQHISQFANAGFNVSDMIAMVACGHTLGGVLGNDFPDITGNGTVGNKVNFEKTTAASFDNAVVTEYLDGTTENPLVVGTNDTFNSDKRVFSADGNTTMKAMADPQAFRDTCTDILGRMIDTVPKTVTLSDVITPTEVKPTNLELTLNADRKLAFSGRLRVRTTNRDDAALTVTLDYKQRNGEHCANCTLTTKRPTFKGGQSYGFREVFTWYEFSTILEPSTSISSFTVNVITNNTSTEVFDNGGEGFPISDNILNMQDLSCIKGTTSNSFDPYNLTLIAAVRNDLVSENVRADWVAKIDRDDIGVIIPRLEVQPIPMQKWEVYNAGEFYTLFRGQKIVLASQYSTNFDFVAGDQPKAPRLDFQSTSVLTDTCAPF